MYVGNTIIGDGTINDVFSKAILVCGKKKFPKEYEHNSERHCSVRLMYFLS